MSVRINLEAMPIILAALGAALIFFGLVGPYMSMQHDIQFYYLWTRFDLASDSSLPTWYSSVNLLIGACLCAVLSAATRRSGPTRDARYWTALSFILLLFSADEVAMFHEWTGDFGPQLLGWAGIQPTGAFYYAWVSFGLVGLAALVLFFVGFILRQNARLRNLMIVAAGVFFSGALGVEMVNSWLAHARPDNELAYMLMTVFEEAMEITGVLLFIYALFRHIGRLECIVTLDLRVAG